MKTMISIDEKLLQSAKKVSGLKTKEEVVEEALKLLLNVKNQAQLKSLRGKMKIDSV